MPVKLIEKGQRKREHEKCPNCGTDISVTYDTETKKIISCSERFNGDTITCDSCGSTMKWTPQNNKE